MGSSAGAEGRGALFVIFPAGEGEEEDLGVEPEGPVFDVIDVVLDSFREVAVAAQAVDLRPAGHAGFHEVSWQVVRDDGGELVDVVRAFGARADEAHVAAEDVPKLREFVDVPVADKGADAEQAGVVGAGADGVAVVGVGVGRHAAEFVEGKGRVARADACLFKKYGTVG